MVDGGSNECNGGPSVLRSEGRTICRGAFRLGRSVCAGHGRDRFESWETAEHRAHACFQIEWQRDAATRARNRDAGSKSPPSAAAIENGKRLYQRFCSGCHGDVAVSGGVLPDLRYSSALANEQWFEIVLDGLLQPNGMVSFAKELSRRDAESVRAYVISRANETKAESAHSAAK
ncbi:MAG: cytochrome c [Candidatus Acidiferrales bacterium]